MEYAWPLSAVPRGSSTETPFLYILACPFCPYGPFRACRSRCSGRPLPALSFSGTAWPRSAPVRGFPRACAGRTLRQARSEAFPAGCGRASIGLRHPAKNQSPSVPHPCNCPADAARATASLSEALFFPACSASGYAERSIVPVHVSEVSKAEKCIPVDFWHCFEFHTLNSRILRVSVQCVRQLPSEKRLDLV